MRNTGRIAVAAGLRAAAVLVVTGLALAAGPAMAQSGSQSLYVRNSGSVPLEDIRVSPDYSTRWGGDRLGAVVEPGDGVTVDLGDHENDCFFDVQVGNANGESREFWGVNVCDQRHLEVR